MASAEPGGAAFYLLSAGLALTAALNLYQGHRPEATLPGVIISGLSICFMWFPDPPQDRWLRGAVKPVQANIYDSSLTDDPLQQAFFLGTDMRNYLEIGALADLQ